MRNARGYYNAVWSLVDAVMRLIDSFLQTKPERPLYHYTDAAGLIGILKSRAIWASSCRHLNDPQEFTHAVNLIEQVIAKSNSRGLSSLYGTLLPDAVEESSHNALRSELYRQQSETLYVASFSENKDVLSQWRAYCSAGNGYSIGFAPAVFRDLDNDFHLIKCVYKPSDQRRLCQALVDSFLETESALDGKPKGLLTAARRLGWVSKLLLVAASIKSAGFKEEAEWRLVVTRQNDDALCFRPGRFGVVPFVSIPLAREAERLPVAEIVTGPSQDRIATRIAAIKIASRYVQGRVAEGRSRNHVGKGTLVAVPECIVSNSTIEYRN